MAEETNKSNSTITVACCGECPFKTPENKCSEDASVEIDVDTMDDDVPTICPMLSGHARASGDNWVKLEDWILKQYPDNIED